MLANRLTTTNEGVSIMTDTQQILREGGKWLGKAREGLQTYAINGDTVTWASNDIIKGLTVHDFECIVASAIAADRKVIKRG